MQVSLIRIRYTPLARHPAISRDPGRSRANLPTLLHSSRSQRRFCTKGAMIEPQPHPLSASDAASSELGQSSSVQAEPLVMQIVVRRDLFDREKWGVGPLMAQAAHAATAVLHETRDRKETVEYLADLGNMRKVVLQTPDTTTLQKLSTLLSGAEPLPIPHHIWTERPENVPTCIALAPNRREKLIRKALDKSSCRLWRSD